MEILIKTVLKFLLQTRMYIMNKTMIQKQIYIKKRKNIDDKKRWRGCGGKEWVHSDDLVQPLPKSVCMVLQTKPNKQKPH